MIHTIKSFLDRDVFFIPRQYCTLPGIDVILNERMYFTYDDEKPAELTCFDTDGYGRCSMWVVLMSKPVSDLIDFMDDIESKYKSKFKKARTKKQKLLIIK